jgi:hypothetical protein
MFAIGEADIAAILAAFDQPARWRLRWNSAAGFPGLTENGGREAARMIFRWRQPSQDEGAAVAPFTGHEADPSPPTPACVGATRH